MSTVKPAAPAPTPHVVPKPGSHKIRRTLLWLAVLLLLAGAVYGGWRLWFANDDGDKKLLTATVTKGDLEDTVTATGTLQPKQFVDVGTQVSGQLKRLLVEVGSVVKAKDLLAEIDQSVYLSKADADRAQLRNQRAQLLDKQAQLMLAQLQFARQKTMAKEEATTPALLQAAEAALLSAQAQVDGVKAQIDQTASILRGDDANLSYTKIYAPMAGTVVSQLVKEGQTLNANQQAPVVLRIADLSVMTVAAQVSEADVPKLRLGMDVYFTTLGGGNRRYYSRLRQILPTPSVLNNVVLYDALFDVPNPKQSLLTQMTAQVFFVLASAKDVLQVPLTALRPPGAAKAGASARGRGGRTHQAMQGADPRSLYRAGRALVSVQAKDGTVSEREVQVGVMTRVAAEITKGLELGEMVVIGTRAAPKADTPKAGAAMTAGQDQRGGR